MKFIIHHKILVKKILSLYIGILLLFSQSTLVYAQELATQSASIEEATPSAGTSSVEASPSAIIETLQDTPSTPSAIITTPIPTPEILLGPSGVLSPSASMKLPPHIRPMTKRTFRAGEVASVVVENIDISTIKATVRDTNGVSIETTPSVDMYDGGVRVMFIPKTSFKPGKYTIVVQDSTTGTTLTQDFLWGVLAFNTDQATYAPGDTASVALAVLDEKGMMVCDADVTLTIVSPTRVTTTLTTGDGSIRVTPECQLHAFTLKPDYETTFQTSDEGVYAVTLTAKTTNGTYSIQDSFQASSDMPFQVKRTSATRIFPPEAYPMTIDITANEDFSGVVTETIPENFTITPLDGSIPYTDVKIVAPVTDLHSHTPISIGMPFEGNYPVTLGFGERLKDPKLKAQYQEFGLKGHDGADFSMPEGTQVLAVDSGKVVRIADEPYGTTVVIDHTWGRSYYGHLSTVQVKEGDAVAKGAPIALSGKTGLTTGPHLHFGMKLTKNDVGNGYYGKIDPMPYVTSSVIYQSDRSAGQISWNVTIKKNENIRLGYTYKAPGISPQFYLLGPLTFRATREVVPTPTVIPDNPFVLGVVTESAQPSDASASAEVTVNAPANSIVYQEPRRWQLAVDAAPNLNTLYPTAWSSTTGTAWSPNTSVNIDEGIAGADGVFNAAGTNSVSQVFFDITDMPSDFVNMKTLNYDIRYKVTPLSGDTVSMYVQVFKSDKTTVLTDEMLVVTTTTALTIQNKGSTAFTGVSTTATHAEWNAAYFRIRTAYTKSGGADNSVWSVDAFEMTGTYQAAPTVSLITPTDGATGQSTTPSLVFTGTDPNGDTVDYQVQVDTSNGFNSATNYTYVQGNAYQDSFESLGADTTAENIGQGFYNASVYPVNFSRVVVRLAKQNSPTDGLIMNIYSLLNGASIATSNTVSQSLLSASLTDIAFDFSTPVNIDAEMSIFFGISRTGSLDGTNFYLIGTDTNDTYNQGNEIHTTSGVWSYGAFDLYFEIYSGGSPSPLINALSTDLTGFTEDADGIYPSGTEVTYTVQTALTPGITYYWRVRAKDPLGSNTWGAWSPGSGSLGYQSFTVEAGVSGPTTDQQMRHGTWFNNNVKQPFTF